MFSQAYKRYVLGTLTLVYTLNYLDRGLVVLLLQPIKVDLHLSDTQLGFLTGIAFGLFYATLGLPIARWADRGNRATITSIAIALWGATVMMCVFVTNFTQLVLARIAAAVGEAGCLPPTYSLVGDYFPKSAERTRAMAIYWLAAPLSALISFIIGGKLNELYGWRIAFLVMGAPALVIALIVKLTVKEPRVQSAERAKEDRRAPKMIDVFAALWTQRSSRHICIGLILLFTMGFGLAPWYAAFMIRSHGMGTAELGLYLGAIFGLGGAAGVLLGGYVVGRFFGEDEKGQVRITAIMIGAMLPCFVAFLLLPQKLAALAALVPLIVLMNFFFGPTFALMQRLVPDEMRATTMAVVMLLANLIGMGLGPQIVGILSDQFTPVFGPDALRYAMLTMSTVAVWSAFHFWIAGRSVKSDLTGASLSQPIECATPLSR